MPYCPTCTYEYHDHVLACPDCGEALLPGAGPPGETVEQEKAPPVYTPDMGQLVPVTNVPNRFMAILLKSQLEDAGIPVLLKSSSGADVGEWSRNDFVPFDIWTPEKLAQDARGIIYGRSDRLPARPAHARPPDDDSYPLDLDTYDISAAGGTTWLALDSPAPLHPAESDWRGLPTESEYLAVRRARKKRAASRAQYWSDEDEDDYYDDADDYAADAGAWWRRRVFRWLFGLLMLAWTLPFMLQFWEAMQDFLDSLGSPGG